MFRIEKLKIFWSYNKVSERESGISLSNTPNSWMEMNVYRL